MGTKYSISNYQSLSDREIVDLVLSGNEEAMLYLLYDRYIGDIRYWVWHYYNSYEYFEDLINYLFLHLKGSNSDWHNLKTFQWKSSFRTWFKSVMSNLFLQKRKELIGLGYNDESILKKKGEIKQPEAKIDHENVKSVILMEAIHRMPTTDFRLILIKELEGYTHKEIAGIIRKRWERDGMVKIYRGEKVIPDVHYVDMNKPRALEELKPIVEQVKKEWYENK